ncbi:hypothetical protein [Deinococcus soli (ex Cha et al. 2016)]|uniref:Uncharacterized protein n=2 Tax=Deinococcus soli (ex Cha et al. 2016) TaxID=1309411 RepID=A0AAE3XCC6_9DEIO|nr:hypothetical protein [Deinococcus soli (ex Cha et al. 2016)]MDR6218303.1 hypothetical protein [Deinococcus soli (ex Cha et al. 2016)]MDR6329043.1 hypothetical protein [Deinococcus soli (ex Cha et al. 2016)]MDR6751316.1 hypothetical protein [Deinococcus soli (ex Cha et al. 2016)]
MTATTTDRAATIVQLIADTDGKGWTVFAALRAFDKEAVTSKYWQPEYASLPTQLLTALDGVRGLTYTGDEGMQDSSYTLPGTELTLIIREFATGHIEYLVTHPLLGQARLD